MEYVNDYSPAWKELAPADANFLKKMAKKCIITIIHTLLFMHPVLSQAIEMLPVPGTMPALALALPLLVRLKTMPKASTNMSRGDITVSQVQ